MYEQDRNYINHLAIPKLEFDPARPYRRLLFHYSPKSKVLERGDQSLIPKEPLISSSRWTRDDGSVWTTLEKYVKEKLPTWATDPYIFFFLDNPEPEGWKDLYPWYFEYCMAFAHKGEAEPLALFALETEESDEAYVVDRYHIAQSDWNFVTHFGPVHDYPWSRVSLAQYQGDYKLPEVIIPHPIVSNRLTDLGLVTIPDVPLENRPQPKPSMRDFGRFP